MLFRSYQEILNYSRKNNWKLQGFSYEMGINENVASRIEDYIIQIEIPLREK